MRRTVVFLGRIAFVLFLLAGLSVCTLPDQSESPPPEDALTFDQLLTGLDELQGPATRSPSAPGSSVFGLPDGSLFSSADLSAYINAIKKDLAAYIYSCTGGAPYPVIPKAVTFDVTYPEPVGTVRESGLIWVPYTWAWWRRFPVISYQHGTQVFRPCAPSCFNANPLAILANPDLTGALQNYVECIVGGLMASAGYIVAMPDYAGFGTSPAAHHPYVNLVLGRSVAGIVRHAISNFKDNGIVYLTGYSEGGYATMAGALALPAVGLNASKVVPCDGPYDLSGTMRAQMLYGTDVKVPSYLLYTASGYKAVHGGVVDYASLLLPEYAALLTTNDMFNGYHTNAEIGALGLPSTPSQMLIDGSANALLALPPAGGGPGGAVYELLAANNAWSGWGTLVKPVFVHCPLDDVVPPENAAVAAGILGCQIRWVAPIPFVAQVMGSIHVGAYPTAMLEAFKILRGN